ncbi:TetR/AcrR family transcriptional regulator [Shimia sp. R11_0]|uniref:TetR/AcrR family transcriptional regulator n=1 Tax=Shimia sp. R11_0 TaxID=2821096 RepID=UPI001ADBCCFE|nr:TetR/AcrR family transcriptional regulator [Shimia sp. R11_0]
MKLTEKKRKYIVTAAIEEFQEHGFRGGKTSRIAKRANVSSRTLYNHFETKDALLDEISKIMIEQKAAVEKIPFDPERDLEEQLAETLQRYVDALTEPETIALTRMVTAEMLIDLERSQDYYAQLATFQDPITQLISEAMDAGAIRRTDPKYASRQLISLIRDFFYTPDFMFGQKQENAGVMSDCIKMFLAHYKAEMQ